MTITPVTVENTQIDILNLAAFISSIATSAMVASENSDKVQELMWLGVHSKLKNAQRMANALAHTTNGCSDVFRVVHE